VGPSAVPLSTNHDDPFTISSAEAPAHSGAAVAAALEADGVVHVTDCITSGMASEMRDSIHDSLEAALRRIDGQPDFGTEYQTHFGNVLSRTHRHDLKLSLVDMRVRLALAALLETLAPTIAARLGGDAQLYELGALMSAPGASAQPVHPDTPIVEGKGTDADATVLTAFCALQDIDAEMGPTLFLPATHTAAAHSAFFTYDNFDLAFGDSADDDEVVEETEAARVARVAAEQEAREKQLASWPTWRALLGTGDVSLFDSRILHGGEANVSPHERILFYCSFVRASHANSWSAQGTLLSSLRGKHELREWREWTAVRDVPPAPRGREVNMRAMPSAPRCREVDMRVVSSATRCRAPQPIACRALVPAMCASDASIRGRSLDEARAENGRSHAEAISRSEATYGAQCCSAEVNADEWAWDAYAFPGTASARSAIGVDANALRGFEQDELARVSTVPLVSRAECEAVIAEAEAVAAWETSGQIAHYARRAGSLTPVSDLPSTLEWLRDDFLANRLFPAIQSALPSLERASLRMSDARLVKYNASAGQIELGMHRDGPLVTATVALNPPTEYDGGGTLIEALATKEQSGDETIADASRSLRVEAGHVVLHPGAVRHGGCRILSGIRYVLVMFIFDANVRMQPSARRPATHTHRVLPAGDCPTPSHPLAGG
jgi:ectoine hydroxylase-related dioxygenase (phytanoyl-CoA dioxygenase family)